MARIWTELADPERHIDYMLDWTPGGHRVRAPRDNLLRHRVLLVEVCGITLQLHSRKQLGEAILFFSRATHPSSREPHNSYEHYWQHWSQRLPKGLSANSKRIRILAALQKAERQEAGKLAP